ncbi:family 78 glycoside hydrolase catalytic domain [Naasia lichenicola]|uniref:alpha-L-rhamnosidase n=1 Tax=Naasia lichenicola TaxID=2565933 RepID=A0A4S4FMX5_9MICO|nr:family 78 glycoside hydrolase catalytic domain [Naasia lichenicola]THG31611.1 alpha-L-rhamnosidase [Naasia lichenicola]
MSEIVCQDLRVEYLASPIGVGAAHPRFSWTTGAIRQNAAEVDVRVGDQTLWTSGRVRPDIPQVGYAGPALPSDAVVDWRVRAWSEGEANPGAWTDGRFETALGADDWTAEWIRPVQQATAVERWTLFDWIVGKRPEAPIEDRLRPVQLLRQSFDIDGEVVRARLSATAHGVYTAQLNGRAVGDEVLAPGFDSYAHRVSVQCYDVTDQLVAGENVLGIALADGWWAGRIGLSGSSAQWGDRTSAIWQLQLHFSDGRVETVDSDGDVRSAPGPWRYADLFIGELFDAGAQRIGWDTPGFDDGEWTAVELSGEDRSTLVPFAGEPIRRVGELAAVSVSGDPAAGWIVDFGQVVAGRLRLTLRGLRAGQEVRIQHTETLTADGAWFANISGINKEQIDVYRAAGDQEEAYEPTFAFHGFRYARITGLDAAPATADVVAVVLSSDLEQTGSFECSDPRLDQLHQNVLWSQRANFLSVPTDCPQRERAGWTGDAQVFAAAAANNAQVVPFLSRWLANLRADQLADGGVPIYSPRSPHDIESQAAARGIGAITVAAGWSDAIVLVPWTLYERTGDRRVLAENLGAMLRWIEYQTRTAAMELPNALDGVELSSERAAAQALLYNTGDHFGDWLTPSTLAGRPLHEAIGIAPELTKELIAPMFQAHSLGLAARIAAILDLPEQAEALAAHAASVRAAFIAEYVSDDGELPVQLQGVYAIALAFDLVPEALRSRAADRLAALVADNGDRLDTGFLSVPHLLNVLDATGHTELARRVLWQTEMPSWLYEVDHGATTIWESWDAIAPDGSVREVSLNHYAFGCVDDWLFGRIAGIRSTAPGYRALRVEPDLDPHLDWVRAKLGTPFGPVEVSWTRRGGEVEVETVLPGGIDAVLCIGGREEALDAGHSVHLMPTPSGPGES